MEKGKLTIDDIIRMKGEGKKIVAITAYDYPSALLVDRAGIDIVLVGDTCGMVVLGYESTIPVTMDEMLHHCRAVKRGIKRALVVGDMPFMSYQGSKEQAITNAGRFIKEGGCDAAKLEGGANFKDTIKAIADVGIPVMGHIGLLPQTATLWSGYRLQGKNADEAMRLVRDANALSASGVFSIVLESIPTEVAKVITEGVEVPTIGIGAGPHCDGQILVLHDLLGLYERFLPRFVKRYANLGKDVLKALESYKEEVQKSAFPSDQHCYHMSKEELEKLSKFLEKERR